MNRLCDGESPHSTRLDVDDLPRDELDHVFRAIGVGDRLVETETGLEATLQLRVPNEVVATERLLDHDEVEGIELRQVIGVA